MASALTVQQKDALKAAFIGILLLGIAVFYLNFQFVGAWVKTLDEQTQAIKEKDIKELEERISQMKAELLDQDEFKRKQALLAEVAKKLPATADPQGFRRALQQVVATTNIEVTEFQPQPPAVRSNYTEIPYRLISLARYHDFGQFLNLIEENRERFMRVKTFTIQNQDDRPSIHPITIDVATFTFVTRG